MMQQVNLLPHRDNRKNALLQSPELLLAVAVTLVFLATTATDSYRINTLEQHHQQLTQQLEAATEHLTNLQSSLSKQTPDNTLLLELQQTQKRYQSLSHIVETLGDDQTDKALGFSRYLTALAEQAQREVWLTRIQIDTDHDNISLQGSTFQPEQIAALIERLKTSAAFKGRRFARLIIQQNPERDGQADFSFSSKLQNEEKADNAR